MKNRTARFLSYYRPQLGLLALDLCCAVIISAIALVLPLCVRHVTGHILGGGSADPLQDLALMAFVMLALVGVQALCNLFVDYQGHMMGARMESQLRRELFAHYQRLSFSFHDERHTGQLMSRITSDLFALSELFHHGPEDIAIGALKFGGVFVITLFINPQLSLIIFVFLPLMLLLSWHFNRQMHAALLRSKQRIAEVNAQVEDSLAGIRVAQSFANEGLEQAKFDAANARFVESRRREYISEAKFYGAMTAFTQLMTVVIVIAGALAIHQAALELQDLITFLLYVGILIEPIQRLVNFARWYHEGITGFHRFMDLLETQPAIQDRPGALEQERAKGALELAKVSFRYGADESLVLRELDLRVAAGETVALVGISGVGKTTLSALIPRFYDVTAGSIRLDGCDIRRWQLASLRRSIGSVQQDVHLFDTSVADNIGYGKPGASKAEIVAAAEQANAHEFICRLPQGYETRIGQRGVKLSAGQRQRLSIARVFLKNPPVIILDEATSALDYQSESAVQASLRRLMRQRTTLIIAHRLSTIRDVKRIIVLDAGRIVEEGSHDQLLGRGGHYARLHQAQSQA